MAAARWKLLGVFGLSACGFAVLAEPSCRTPSHIAQRQAPQVPQVVDPVPVPLAVPAPLPVPGAQPMPSPDSAKYVPAVTTPAETPVVTLPPIQAVPEVKPAIKPTVQCVWQKSIAYLPNPARDGEMAPGISGMVYLPVTADGELFVKLCDETTEIKGYSTKTPEVFHFDRKTVKKLQTKDERLGECYKVFIPLPSDWKNVSEVSLNTQFCPDSKGVEPVSDAQQKLTLLRSEPVAKSTPIVVPEIKEPLPTYSGPLVSPERFAEEVMKPAAKLAETKPTIVYQAIPVPVAVPAVEVRSAPVPTVVPVMATTTTARVMTTEARVDKNLKLNLTLSDTNPKFEIRDGDDVLIKATADQMDVKSGQQKGEVWSSVKATGSVRFTTPGGEGICSELNLNHATGEIKAINAKFTHHWGKVETTVQSDVLTFKLTRQGSSFAVGFNEGR